MLNIVQKISRGMAYIGGIMLVLLIVLTCLSIFGRSLYGILHTDIAESFAPTLASALLSLGIGPIKGDYELLEAGIAFSIFAFMPLCQLYAAHASVDVFTSLMSDKVSNFMIWISELVFALVLILIAWQLTNGFLDKFRSNQTTFLLEFPVWWAYGLSMIGSYVAAFVAIVVSYFRSREYYFGEKILTNLDSLEQ
jgi:TRAP-type C4-dicarboxylate transport system permease small subunit